MNFGNKVAKNWRKNIYYGNQVVKIVGEERKIIRNFGMPKMEGGKKNCGNEVAENWRSHSTLSYSYSPETFKYIEYILYSFPIKPANITHIEFMSCIDSFSSFYFSSSL